ncbi:hypothetical protein [Spirosoma radiotolerans]|uniref:Uncharacterized protein n=1 Tax=Spirosoma radiotolerans TaxID=1379870 RepID=A0A0E3ZTJ0_9BACT|nr:hypothetical protein [Spirosoma radiotolerans]AKD55023.1 hypothetical protein SD10_09020 [Spirosoma radiotolerans]
MENQGEKSQKSQAQTAAKEISADKAKEIAGQNADANAGTETTKSPEEAAKAEATANGESEETRIARAVAAIRKDNPDMSIDDVIKLVAGVFKKTETVEAKVAKEASTIIDTTPSPFKEKIYLKKDKDRQFPLEKEALNGIVVRQTYKRETEEGDKITVPARNLNEIAIYSQEDFDRLNHGDPKKPGFAREGISVEVWHKPGQTDSVAE